MGLLPSRPTPMTLVDLVEESGRRRGDTPMYFDRPLDLFPHAGLHVSYRDFAEMMEQASSRLHNGGVRAGDTVAVIKSNHLDVFILACAAMRIGAIPALLSAELEPAAAAAVLATLGRPAVVTDPDVIARKALHGRDLGAISRRTLVIGGTAPGAQLLPEPSAVPPRRIIADVDAPALITHTSGTTGVPKLAVQSHRTLHANWAMAARVSRALRIRETVAVYLLFAHARVVTGMAGLLKMGWPLVVLTDAEPGHAEAVLSEHRPGVIETFPNTFILWEEMASSASRPFRNVNWFLNTFDAMHPRTRNALLESSSRRVSSYIQMYGQTETGPVTMRVYPRGFHRDAHPRCVGYPLPGFSRFKVLDEGQGSGGAILAKSKALILGYVGQEEDYRAKFDGEWWQMTDVGCKSRWGCLHLLDREIDESDAVASLLALEDMILERLPNLAEVALIPKANGPPVPLVCTRDGRPFDHGAWMAATADLELLMPPVHCAWEDIPQTGTWKVRRVEARRRLDEGCLVGLWYAA